MRYSALTMKVKGFAILGSGLLAAALSVAGCEVSSSNTGSGASPGTGGSGGAAPGSGGSAGIGTGGRGAAGSGGGNAPCGAPGTLDTTFANGGTLMDTPKTLGEQVTSDGGLGLYVAYSPLDAQPLGPDASVGVVHLDRSGKIDTTFGSAGDARATYPHVDVVVGVHRGVLTGSIYVIADSQQQSGASTLYTSTIVHFTKAGQVDMTFGGDGHVELGGGLLNAPGYVTDVMERQDGSVLVLLTDGFALLSADGTIKSTKDDQTLEHNPPPRIVPLASGSFMTVGALNPWVNPTSPDNPTVVRYTPSLAKDTSYGLDGEATVSIEYDQDWAYAAEPGGAMILGGASGIASLDPNGHLVSSFGNAGIVSLNYDWIVATLARSDGSVIYLPTQPLEGPNITVTALTAQGLPDSSFGTAGSFSVPKSITRPDPAHSKVDAQYVTPTALIKAGPHRAYLVAMYETYTDATKRSVFDSMYISRFCTE